VVLVSRTTSGGAASAVWRVQNFKETSYVRLGERTKGASYRERVAGGAGGRKSAVHDPLMDAYD